MSSPSRKSQEQLDLPELEPAFALEIQSPTAPAPDAVPPDAVRTPRGKTVRRKEARRPPPPAQDSQAPANATPKPRRKTGATVRPATAPAELMPLPPAAPPLPQLSYNRHEDCLRIAILPETIVEDRSERGFAAGYTVDGRLAEIRLFNPGQHPAFANLRANAAPLPVDTRAAAMLAAIREELLFLKAGLGLVLAGLIWLLLK